METESNNNSENKSQDNDVIRNTIGDFGKWQLRISVLMALLKFPIAWFQIGSVLLAPPTKFHCQKPDFLANFTDFEWESLFNSTQSMSNDTKQYKAPNSCFMPNTSTLLNDYGFEETEVFSNKECNNGFTYDTSVFRSSIISEWNLVCDDEYLVELSQIILMFGVLIGNIIFGVTADKYGRKKSLMISIVVQAVAGIMTAVIPSYWGFVFFRFIVGIANGGTAITSFVLCMEIVGGKYRTIVPILYQIPFGLATSTMAALSYWLRDWRQLQLTLSGLSALFITYYWMITESPRWLIAVGRTKKCEKILEQICDVNKTDVKNVNNYFKQLEKDRQEQKMESGCVQTKKQAKLSDLFKSWKLARRTILLYFNWFLTGISFFAFSLHIGHIGSNNSSEDSASGAGVRTVVAFAGLGAIPGALLCAWIARVSGRKKTLLIANIAAAVCLLALAVTTSTGASNWLKVLLVVINVIAMAVYTPALHVYTGELFPTVVRNAGVGVAVMFSRIGSMLAPLLLTSSILNSTETIFMWNISPILLTLSVLALIQALLVIPLPETRGKPLPDKIEDIDKNSSSNNNSNEYSAVKTSHLMSNSDDVN